MLSRNHPDRIQITFDDRRLVANAGLKRLRDWEHPIPDALARWSEEVESGARAQPTIGHRPVSVIYRDGAVVKTIRDLTDRQFWGMSVIAIPTANVSQMDNGLKNADDLLRGIFSHMGNVG